jgi:hypothetical protein
MLEMLWWGKLKGRNCFEGLVIDGKIILKCVLKTCDGIAWTGFIWNCTVTNIMHKFLIYLSTSALRVSGFRLAHLQRQCTTLAVVQV